MISILGGSVLGLISGGLKQWMQSKAEDQKHQHKVELLKLGSSLKLDETDAESFLKGVSKIEEPMFHASYAQYLPRSLMGAVGVMFALLDILRSSIRPVLTIALMVCFILVIRESFLLTGMQIVEGGQAVDILNKALDLLLHACGSALAYYFSDRTLTKHFRKD